MLEDGKWEAWSVFYATVARNPVDRPASWLGIPSIDALPALFKHFSAEDMRTLKLRIMDDIWPAEMPYHSPQGNAIYAALDFSVEKMNERTLTAKGFFADYTDPDSVDTFDWPDPARYISPEECRRVVDELPNGYAKLGVVWSAHFQDACAAFGMENALMTMLTEPSMFKAVIDRITEFYLRANEIFYEAAKGRLHAVLIGNDYGSQTGMMISPDCFREFALPGTKRLIQQAKAYGLVVIHHSCGSIKQIIDDLICAGVDVIHPIQALASGMEPRGLKAEFSDRISFCGGVDARQLLVNGKPQEVEEKVRELASIFPTGLIISPSHEAILPDIPPVNIEALFRAVHHVKD